MSACCAKRAPAPHWQVSFLALLPALERSARQEVRRVPSAEREEALQYILVSSAVAFARLAQQGRAELAYPTPLALYGLQRYRAGRLIGGSTNSRDVASQRARVESLDQWQDILPERCSTTPADLAALRIDFAAWLATLSRRDQALARTLARGERTSAVAQMFRLTAGRVSQLRQELYTSWRRFVGEATVSG